MIRTPTSPRRSRSRKTFRMRDGTIGDLRRSFSRQTGEMTMLRKITTMALIGASLAIAACNTVRGAANGCELGRQRSRQRHLMKPWSLRYCNGGVTMFRKATTMLLIGGSLRYRSLQYRSRRWRGSWIRRQRDRECDQPLVDCDRRKAPSAKAGGVFSCACGCSACTPGHTKKAAAPSDRRRPDLLAHRRPA